MTTTSRPNSQPSLSQKTAQYWEVSSILNGRLDKKLTTGGAITATGKLLSQLGPDRTLTTLVNVLHNRIVYGAQKGKGKSKQPSGSDVHYLKLPQAK